MKFYLMKR